MRRFIVTFLTLSAFNTLGFDEIRITPNSPQGWQAINVRDDAMVEINDDQPLFGDGSLMFFTDTLTAGQDKADFEFLWQQSQVAIDFPNRTLGNLLAFSHAWYRDGISTTGVNLIPAVRLRFYDDGGTPAIPADDTVGLLIWEGVYNGIAPATTDSWQLSDTFDDNFWIFVTVGPNGTGVINNYNSTLNDWINTTPQGQVGDPSVSLSADTYIIGMNAGVGSGWNNSITAYVDSMRVSFGPNDDFLFNFESCDIFVENTDPDVIFADSFECFVIQ